MYSYLNVLMKNVLIFALIKNKYVLVFVREYLPIYSNPNPMTEGYLVLCFTSLLLEVFQST